MKVFISWSGPTSHKVAIALREWVPLVIQSIEPYVSSEDIEKGARWAADVASQLDDTTFGILCVTPDNISAPWLNFEAGALSKAVDRSRVAPFLFGVKPSDISGPLAQFQSTLNKKADALKLLHSINNAHEQTPLSTEKLSKTFDVFWPALEKSLSEIRGREPEIAKIEEESTDQSKVLEEILELVRRQSIILTDSRLAIGVPKTFEDPAMIPRSSRFDHKAITEIIAIADEYRSAKRENRTLNSEEIDDLFSRLWRPIMFLKRARRHLEIDLFA